MLDEQLDTMTFLFAEPSGHYRSESGTCVARLCSPRSASLGPPTPRPVAEGLFASFIATMKRSDFSWLFGIGFDSSSSRCGPLHYNLSGQQEISRFSCKERTYMPGSQATQGHPGTRTIAPVRIASNLTASAP
jgi:hypothetical protein